MNDYQFLVIGSGPGGYVAALHAASHGLRTAVVEARQAGGTCLNRGCVPTKALLHASEIYHNIHTGAYAGITAEHIHVDMPAIFARKRQVTQQLSDGIRAMFKTAKIDWIEGTGTVMGPHTVSVQGADGVTTYTADDILVATGSVPARPPIPGLDLPGVLTSDELLEGCDHLYTSLVIIGGGVIGVEFATFYNDLGCDVTIVEGMDRLLPAMDAELGKSLAMVFKKRGVTVHTNALVQSITQTADGYGVQIASSKGELVVTGQAVLCAIGRQPLVQGVFAPDFQPELDGRLIRVNERFQTSLPHVYAVGDVASRIQLAHVASAQGVACVDMLCNQPSTVDLHVIPSCIYCRPEIASVGMTEQEAKTAGIATKTGKCTLFSNAKTVIANGDRAFMKVVARTDNHRIIGAQLMCQNSTDMISQLSQAIANEMTVEQLLRAMRPHPTFEEALHDALEDLVKKLETV